MKKSFQKYIKNPGFTLIEMMIVIMIVGLLSALVFANMRSGGRMIDVNSDAEKLAEVIKQAQMMSLTGQQIGGSRPSGYGVNLDTNTYKLFADDGVVNQQYDTGSDTLIQTFTLTNGVALTPNDADVVFIVPNGSVYIDGILYAISDGFSTITVSHSEEGMSAWVTINSHGEINTRKTQP